MIRLFLFLLVSVSLVLSQDKSKNSKKKKDKIVFSNNQDSKEYLKLYQQSFDKLKINFVDSINESEMLKSGIKGMLNNLDPYTKLLEGSSLESYDVLRKGKYGGVGIRIGLVRDTLTVLAPMEDSPAYSEGIHSGDQIMMIDTTSTIGLNVKQASELIKGELDSVVVLGVIRPATKQKIDFELKRANIRVKHVPYWGIDEDGIGYIKLSRFSRNAASDFKEALVVFKKENINGLVIDLRGNSGGLLNNAINILDYLSDRGEVLLSSKGKSNRANKEWKSRRKPIIDIDIPIAVLINKSSASASEIVAGALQDLDRAIIIGQKSFGKGLVQHMFDLNDTTTLKITTAKYYLPSGRLIQKEDYLNNGFLTDGLDEKDSLFVTKGGRVVKGGGGIYPDIKTSLVKKTNYINALWKEGVFLSFAASYVPFHPDLSIPLNINDDILNEFRVYLKDYEIDYAIQGEKDLERLKNKILKSSISINKFSKNISEINNASILNEIENYFKQIKSMQFSLPENRKWIKNGLLREMSRIISGEKERIRVSLFEDEEYNKAVSILLNLEEYDSKLGF